MAILPESPNITMCPSGGALATILAARMPPAPGMFSTMKGLPNLLLSFSASRRASTSGLPPGPEGAISRTVWVGHASSWAIAAGESIASSSARTCNLRCMAWSSSVAPNVARNLDHQAQLSLLHFRRDRIAGVDAGEAALRADPEAVEIKLPRRLLDALLQRILAFHLRRLGRDNAEHHGLVGRHEPQRRERAGARRVVFEEVELDVERVEQPLGHVVIAPFRVPLAAAVAAAQMHADPHALRCILEHTVGDGDVLVDQRAPVVAARLQRALHLGVAELGEGGLVDLYVTATGFGERLQLAAERFHGVVPELVEVGVVGGEHGGVAAAEMQRAGAGDGDLGNEPGVGCEELEVRHVDWAGPLHAASDQRDRLAATLADGAGLGAALGVFAANGVDAEIAELAVEETVIGAAAEFAVGRELQPDALLQRQRLLDRGVLGGGERLAADFAASEPATLVEQGLRTKQAADVFGSERRVELG